MTPPLLTLEQSTSTPLAPEEREGLIERIADEELKRLLSSEGVTAKRFELPFYGDVTLLAWSSPAWNPSSTRVCFLEYGEELMRLDGTSPPIHAINAKADLIISRSTALSYLAFFCYFVRGDEGPFLVLDRMENAYLPQSSRTAELEKQFRRPAVWGQAANGNWRASALVYYDKTIFAADFTIYLTGMVEMVEDTPVLPDLPEKVVAPLEADRLVVH